MRSARSIASIGPTKVARGYIAWGYIARRYIPGSALGSLAALILLSSAACGRQQDAPVEDQPIADQPPAGEAAVAGTRSPVRPSVVLISIDTLRSDHLPIYGYGGVATPAIDALARDGIVFERAYSHTPLTLPSHVSILTGQLPATHGVRDNQGYAFDSAKVSFLPRDLKHLGYATGAAVSAWVLRGGSGIAADFDLYQDSIEAPVGSSVLGGISRPGEATLAAVEPWLRSVSGGPFLLLFHLFEPHMPYTPADAGRYAHAYDGEIAAADRVVGRLIELLRELDVYDQATIVLLSDHGEGLGDHGELEHGILLYREALQIPLVIKLPSPGADSGRAGSRVYTPVQLVDVYPTILEVVGASVPESLPGTSLLALPESGEPRRLYAETFYPRLHYGWSDLVSIIEGDRHYIDGPDPELYNLADDGDETRNLVGEQRRLAGALRRHLESLDRGFEAPAAVDPETRAKLAALGYLGGASAPSTGTLPDPKAQLPSLDDLRRAAELVSSGAPAAAVPLYRKALAANPRMVDGWQVLGDVLRRLGDLEQALAAYSRAFELSGGDPHLATRLAAGYQRLGLSHLEQRAWQAAREASRRAVDLDPSRDRAWNNLGVACYYLGDHATALDAWQRAVEIDPGQLDTLYNLGTRAAELGRREQARKALDSFIEQAPPERYGDDLRRARVLRRRLLSAEDEDNG